MAAVKTTKIRGVVYVLAIFILAEFGTVHAEPGLVAWWKMDDGSGIIAEDSAGDANGTLVNGPVWTTGIIGGALDLDGSDDYVSVPGVSGSGPVDNITFACWIYPQITSSYRAIYNHDVFSAGGVHFQITSSSTLQLAVVGTSYFYTVSTFNVNQWYHVAVVYSNSSALNYARFYINGVPESSIPVGTASQVDLTKTALIGACDMGGSVIGRNFDGMIDDLRIYDSIVNETRIQQLASVVSPATSPVPNDGATEVSIDSPLSWQPGVGGALSYDVYFDTNNPPTTLIADDITDTNVYAGPLEYDQTYYWQVDKNTAGGMITGDVWRFSTVSSASVFTFQGRLLDNNVAADGIYDFQFKLFDSAHEVYSKQQGGDVNTPDVDVIDGYFTVELDFGSDVFTGEARWLEIGVRPGNSNDAYATLRPRQQLTAVPYALRTRGQGGMERQIANLQKQSYTSSFASLANIEDCTQSGDGIDCQQKMIVGVDVHEGYPIVLDTITIKNIMGPNGPIEIEEVARIEIEKRWRQPAPTIHSFDVHVKVIMDTDVHEFDVSPAFPVYDSKQDAGYQGTFHIIASLVRDSRIVLNINADKIKWVTTESPGYIMLARIESYEPSASEAQLTVRIKNDGDLKASYFVTVTDHDPAIEPMVAQTRLLDDKEEAELTFNLRTNETFKTGSRMKVSIWSTKGKLYDFVWVYFP